MAEVRRALSALRGGTFTHSPDSKSVAADGRRLDSSTIVFEPPVIVLHFIVITETLAPTSLMRQHSNKHGCGDNDRNKDEKQHQSNQYLQYYAHNKGILGLQRYNILTKPKIIYWLKLTIKGAKCHHEAPSEWSDLIIDCHLRLRWVA